MSQLSIPEKAALCGELYSQAWDPKLVGVVYDNLPRCMGDTDENLSDRYEKLLTHRSDIKKRGIELVCVREAKIEAANIINNEFIVPANADIEAFLASPGAISQSYTRAFNSLIASRDKLAKDPLCGSYRSALDKFSVATGVLIKVREDLLEKNMGFVELMGGHTVSSSAEKFVDASQGWENVVSSYGGWMGAACTLGWGVYKMAKIGTVIGWFVSAVTILPSAIRPFVSPSDLDYISSDDIE